METCEIKGWYLTLGTHHQKKHAAFFQKATSAPGGWVMVAFAG